MKNHFIFRIFLLFIFSLHFTICDAQAIHTVKLDSSGNFGKYDVATLTQSDGIRNGPRYAGAKIYYPTNATPPYASVVIVPGFLCIKSTIKKWGPFLASHGIVTMTIGTNSIFQNPSKRKEALLDAIITLNQENRRNNSPLSDKLDTNKMAVSGWSMGGGGAQLAAKADSNLKAVIVFCPWLNHLRFQPSDVNHTVPVLIFSGKRDKIARPKKNANVHYASTPETTDKLIYEIKKGGHFIATKPTKADGSIGELALFWLNTYLLSDTTLLPETPTESSKYTTNIKTQ